MPPAAVDTDREGYGSLDMELKIVDKNCWIEVFDDNKYDENIVASEIMSLELPIPLRSHGIRGANHSLP